MDLEEEVMDIVVDGIEFEVIVCKESDEDDDLVFWNGSGIFWWMWVFLILICV